MLAYPHAKVLGEPDRRSVDLPAGIGTDYGVVRLLLHQAGGGQVRS